MEMRYYYRIIARHRWTIVATTLACAGLMVLLLLIKGPRYEASVLIREQPLAESSSRLFGIPDARGRTRERLANLAALATGREVMQRTRKRLGLDRGDSAWSFEISAEPVGWSELLKVSVRSPDQRQLPTVANTLVAELAGYYRDLNLAEMRSRREFVEKGLADAKRAYEAAQAELDAYKKSQRVVSLDSETLSAVDTIARLRADQTAAAVDTERLTAMEKTWQSELAGPAQARAAREALAANPLVSRLREQLAEQETQLAGLRLKYTDEHRAVKDAQRAIEQTRTRLQEETSKALAAMTGSPGAMPESMWTRYVTIQTDLAAARARSQAVSQAIATAQQQLPQLVERESRLAALVLARDSAMATYTLFRSKLGEMATEEREAEGSKPIQVVEAASGAYSVARVPQKLGLAVALGLLLGISVAMLLHYLDNTIQDVDDARALQLPVQAVIPISGRPLAALHDGSTNGAAEPYELLRANLFYGQRALVGSGVVVTAAMPRAGKSTVAANLAVTLARDGHRVLLIDADLRRPTQHLLFGVEAEPGLTEVLLGRAPLSEALRRTEVPGLSLLPSGARPENAAALLSSQAMQRLLGDLRHLAEMVVFDTPPGSCFADAAFVAGHVGNVLLVLAPGESQPDLERAFCDQLNRIGARLVGVVVNKTRPEHAPGYYAYQSYYGRGGRTAADAKAARPGHVLAPMARPSQDDVGRIDEPT